MSPPPVADDGGVRPPSDLPPEAFVTALASLSGMGPSRLRALLDQAGPQAGWALVRGPALPAAASATLVRAMGRRPGDVADRWRSEAGRLDPVECWGAHLAAGVGVVLQGSAAYPVAFADDPEPPPVLFSRGDLDGLVGPRVAVVGTRDCTRYGYDVARQLGAELTAAGVRVVSGLALGIDGAAHTGALEALAASGAVGGPAGGRRFGRTIGRAGGPEDGREGGREGSTGVVDDLADGAPSAGPAPPVAVVGSGLDVVYPRRHRELWARVADAGVVLSEHPLGVGPLAWHFPARNRIIAALADVVVIVESQVQGGSMHTVEEALRRQRTVLAVPGSVRSKVSAGPNKLLHEGAGVARDSGDVLVALGLDGVTGREVIDRRPRPQPGDAAVLDAFDWQPATLNHLVLRTGLDLTGSLAALDRLVEAGWVERRGGWFERVARPGG